MAAHTYTLIYGVDHVMKMLYRPYAIDVIAGYLPAIFPYSLHFMSGKNSLAGLTFAARAEREKERLVTLDRFSWT